MPKLSDEDVYAIRLAAQAGTSEKLLSERYSVVRSTVRMIVQGKSRLAAGGPISPEPRSLPKDATEEDIRQMAMNRLLRSREIDENGCWLWTGALSNGYGSTWVGKRSERAHRVAYMLFVGEIPAGRVVDHMCHNADEACPGGRGCRHRRCFNPHHLRVTDHGTNIRAGRANRRRPPRMYCTQGHLLDDANTITRRTGQRLCRICVRVYQAWWHRQRRAAA